MWAARRCLKSPMQGPFPRVRLRADIHMPATQCCAARNTPPISSQSRLVAPAARQLGATPSKIFAARPHCGRAPTHATVPLGSPPPLTNTFSRGGANPESRVAADVHQKNRVPPAPPPEGPTMSAACATNGSSGHSRPHAHEYQISRRLCDRQRNVCPPPPTSARSLFFSPSMTCTPIWGPRCIAVVSTPPCPATRDLRCQNGPLWTRQQTALVLSAAGVASVSSCARHRGGACPRGGCRTARRWLPL